jgi:SAM-dependent methyltransferase
MNKNCSSILTCKEEKTLAFEKNGYSIFDCKKCGHRFLDLKNPEGHVSKVYSDDYFFSGGQGYPNYLDQKKILVRAGLRYARIISKYSKPGKVLDVGCAAGFVLKGFEKSGWDCYGLEPNETMAAYGRDQFQLKIETGNLENFHSKEKFSLINLIQVIGHFYDLDAAIKNLNDLAAENGLILIESWDMKSRIARLEGKKWHEYSPPSVLHWFSDETLEQLFNYYGFELLAKGRPAKKINVKHLLAFYKEKFPRFTKPVFKGLQYLFGGINIPYLPLDLKWYVFRKKP